MLLYLSSSRSAVKRTVIFAEPVAGNKQLDVALLPGDRLLQVNGQNVQDTNREDIIDIIRNSGSTVTLRVRMLCKDLLCLTTAIYFNNISGVS